MNALLRLREQARDRKIARQVCDGDARAFGLLYDTHVPRVFGLLRRLCHSADEAEDLTQETFLAVPDALPQWRGDSALSTFLCGIAYRKWARTRRGTRATMPLTNADEIADGKDDLLASLSRQELSRALYAAIRDLPDDLRVVFVLVRVEELAYKDAAAILQIPLGTLQSRLHRAHRLLRAALAHAVPELVAGALPAEPLPPVALALTTEKGIPLHVLD